MADVTTLGISINLDQVKRAISSLETLAKAAGQAEKQVQEIGEAAKDGSKAVIDANDKAVASFAKAARAMKQLEDAQLKGAKTEVERAKASRVAQQQLDASLAAKIQRENAYAAAIDRSARLAQESSSRQAATSAREAANLALKQKYLDQGNAALSKTAAFAANQQSLIENRTLTTQSRIEQGAQRLALQQEKFEYQKQRAAERAAKGTGDSWKSVLGTLRDLTVAGFGVTSVFGFAKEQIQTADNLTLLSSRLKLATKDQDEFKRTQDSLYESSIRNGLSIEAQVDSYTQLHRSTKAMGLTTQQLTFLTESFAKAAVVSGASSESYKSALTQLNQGLASGVLRGQEFNSVSEQAPAIMEALANGMRGTNKEFDALEKKGFLGVAALRKMANEGKLVNSVTMPALIEGLKQTNKQYESMPMTVGRAIESISTSYKKWLNDQNSASGSTTALANSLFSLSQNFGAVAGSITNFGAIAAIVFGGRVVSSIAASTKAMYENVIATNAARTAAIAESEASLLQARSAETVAVAELNKQRAMGIGIASANTLAIAQARVTAAQGATVAATVAYEAAVGSATVATSAFSKALSLVGGPVGIAITALITLAVYWDDITKSILGATAAHKDFMKQQAAISTANRGTEINDALKAQVEHTKALRTQLEGLRKESARGFVNPDTLMVDLNAKVNFRKKEETLQNQIRESVLKEQELEITRKSRNALVTAEVQSSFEKPTFKGPTVEDKKTKAPSLLGAGESEKVRSEGILDALREELALTQQLGTAKDNLNEYQKQAFVLQRRLDALDPAAKKYEEAKANLEAQLSTVKQAGALKAEIDQLQERNKAINEWRQNVDKIVEKQEALATFSAADIVSKSTESTQERTARVTKENYEAALKALNNLNKISVAPEGVPLQEQKSAQARSLAVAGTGGNTEQSFQDQLDAVDLEMSRARFFEQDQSVFEALEEKKTAILAEQTRQRMLLHKQEQDSVKAGLSSFETATSTMLNVLENANGKQSGIYQAMFAVNKAFAVANSIVNIQKAIADGWATGTTIYEKIAAVGTIVAQTASIVSTISSTNMKFAKGSAFSGAIGAGSDVLTTPTAFPMSGGRTGLAGEVSGSPEAIMPLRRDANGRLGVSMIGGNNGGGQTIQTNQINITVNGGESNQDTANVVSNEVLKAMKSVARQEIIDAKRQRVIS